MLVSKTRALALSALLATAHAASIPHYFRRNGVCGGTPADNLSECARGLDDGLCCGEGQECIRLAGGSTVLCCPEDQQGGCRRMKAITCNLSAQNPSFDPRGPLKTTALRAQLPRCGDNCCPFGFSCNDEEFCVMDEDQSRRPRNLPNSELPPSSSRLPSSIPSPSFISSTTGTGTATPPTSTSEEQQGNGSQDGGNDPLPTAIIVVSVLGGLLALVCVIIGVVMCLARRKRKTKTPLGHSSEKKGGGLGCGRTSTSTSSFGNIISEPIPHQGSALRSDFILKTPDSSASHSSGRTSSGFDGTTATNNSSPGVLGAKHKSPPRIPARTLTNATMTSNYSNNNSNLAVPPIRTMRNQQKPQINTGTAWTKHAAAARAAVPDAATPVEPKGRGIPVTPRLQREPSSESINIFADPSTVGRDGSSNLGVPRPKRYTSATTFTELMEEAQLGDVRRGDPFVPLVATPRR